MAFIRNNMECALTYSISTIKDEIRNRECYLHFAFAEPETAKWMIEKIKQQKIQLDYEINHDVVTIKPYVQSEFGVDSYGVRLSAFVGNKLLMFFASEDEATQFENLLSQITSNYIVQIANIIHFDISHMPQKDMLTISVLPSSPHYLLPWEIDISDKYNKIKKIYAKEFVHINSIADEKILFSDDDNTETNKPIIKCENSETIIMDLYEKDNEKRLMVISANPVISGGGGQNGEGLEEKIISLTNAPFAMPNDLGEGLVPHLGGLYKISNVQISKDNRHAITDMLFISMPNMGYPIKLLKTPSEKKYFTRESYLEHIACMMIQEVYLARFTNNTIIIPRQGCGLFANEDEDLSAVIHVVGKMFSDVQIIVALGKNVELQYDKRNLLVIYSEPLMDKIVEVEKAINNLRAKLNNGFTLHAISKNMIASYLTGREQAMKIQESEMMEEEKANRQREDVTREIQVRLDEIFSYIDTISGDMKSDIKMAQTPRQLNRQSNWLNQLRNSQKNVKNNINKAHTNKLDDIISIKSYIRKQLMANQQLETILTEMKKNTSINMLEVVNQLSMKYCNDRFDTQLYRQSKSCGNS